eukprot:Amastigsp_a175214_40.p5 type:complete len:124 gc:universal Amastigsp_a175214_40:804-433(-)
MSVCTRYLSAEILTKSAAMPRAKRMSCRIPNPMKSMTLSQSDIFLSSTRFFVKGFESRADVHSFLATKRLIFVASIGRSIIFCMDGMNESSENDAMALKTATTNLADSPIEFLRSILRVSTQQ